MIVVAPALLSGRSVSRSYGDLAALGVLVLLGVVSWLVTRWRIEDGDLRIETGLIRRRSLRFPLEQVQAIDVVRPGLARVFGLAELRLRTGSSGTARLAYLTAREAEVLRPRLLAAAHGRAEEIPTPAERVLVSVPVGRLIASILLSSGGFVVEGLVVASIVVVLVVPSVIPAVTGTSAAMVVGVFTTFWRRFNGAYALTVAEAPDGLRLRSGLLETTAETIPQGRVQAVRMVEPIVWRPLGWCRVEVDVAGRQRRRGGENRAESRQLRAVLPVGTHLQATSLLERIVPNAPVAASPPPRRVRAKAPLRYHYLSWGRNETYAVTTTGRLARVTAWVPLAKVQSLRRVQGPVQRRLHLATIHLDTAGRNVRAAARDRDVDEADRILAELIDLCGAAREADRRSRLERLASQA